MSFELFGKFGVLQDGGSSRVTSSQQLRKRSESETNEDRFGRSWTFKEQPVLEAGSARQLHHCQEAWLRSTPTLVCWSVHSHKGWDRGRQFSDERATGIHR